MSDRYQGGVIRAVPLAPTSSSASGIWTMEQQAKAQAAGDWPIPPVTVDPNFNQVSMLLGGEPANSLDYTAFSDASTNNFLLTPSGNPYGTAFSPYNSTFSNYFDGSGDYLTVPNGAGFAFGTGDFTIECWVYWSYTQYNAIISTSTTSQDSGSWILGYSNTANSLGFCYDVPGFNFIEADFSSYHNKWTHVAVTRSGTDLRLYFNGTSVANTTNSTNFSYSANSVKIGQRWSNQDTYTTIGYLSNLRVVKGTAVYTGASFTPPTAPLTAISGTSLLTAQSNRFIDTGASATVTVGGNTKISGFIPFTDTDTTTGSGYFDGSGDYLNTASNSAFNFDTYSTVEAWVYFGSLSSDRLIFGRVDQFWLNYSYTALGVASNKLGFSVYDGGTWYSVSSTTTPRTGTWYHIVGVRDNTTLRLYVNGTQESTTAFGATPNTPSTVINIGGYSSAGYDVTGYISNLRFVKGSTSGALPYTGNFTPPTSPLTAVANTQLLTLQDRAANQNFGFLDTTKQNQLNPFNSPTQGSFSPFSQPPGYWSNYFNGSGYASTSNVFPLTGDFCVEFWVNYYSLATPGGMIVSSVNSSGYGNWCLYYNTTSNVLRLVGTDSSTYIDSPTVPLAQRPTIGTWHHMAVSRSGSTIYWFIDGALLGTTSNSTSWSGTSSTTYIGSIDGTNQKLTGYVSNLRIVRGSAVYTSAFTPSTTPLTAITNTSFLTCQSNQFKDNSSNGYAIAVVSGASVESFGPFAPTDAYDPAVNGGSGYFLSPTSGGAYLQTGANGALSLGTDSFTMECWVYPLLEQWNGPINIGYPWGFNAGGFAGLIGDSPYGTYIRFGWNDGTFLYGDVTLNANGYIKANQWNHLVYQRNGSTITVYSNGYVSTNTLNIGSYSISENYVRLVDNSQGTATQYQTDARIIRGANVYSGSTYTVPTAPLAATSNTVFLCNYQNAGVIDSTARSGLTTVGSAEVVTSTSKFGSGSYYFDGSTGYVTAPISQLYSFGVGDFTVELWAYFNTGVVSKTLVKLSTNNGTTIDTSNTGYIRAGITVAGSDRRITGSQLMTTGQWYHIAFVRTTTVLTLYVNGTSVGTYAIGTEAADPVTAASQIGSTAFNGYIDDLRITKGVARYTTNFTPANYPFPVK